MAGYHCESLREEFQSYCTYELLETAITSTRKLQHMNQEIPIFLKSSFYPKFSNLRTKLVSYFSKDAIKSYNSSQRKKKELWHKLVREKKERILKDYLTKQSPMTVNGFVHEFEREERIAIPIALVSIMLKYHC